jgi:hypothetical protein
MSVARIRIGLVLDYSVGYCRAVLRGIKSFAEARPNWLLTLVPAEPIALDRLRALRPAGLIAYKAASHPRWEAMMETRVRGEDGSGTRAAVVKIPLAKDRSWDGNHSRTTLSPSG